MSLHCSPATHVNGISVFVMDLLCIVPYYTGRFCEALQSEGVDVELGSIDYRCDRECFVRRRVRPARGIVNVTPKFAIPDCIRKPLKLMECVVNLLLLALRILVRPPRILHVQFLYLVEHRLCLELWAVKLARKMGVKVVHTVHNVLPMGTGARHKTVFAQIYGLADALICHNERAKARLLREFGISPFKIEVIPHGPLFADTERPNRAAARARLGFTPNERVVLWQGVVDHYKGLPFLLDAWKALSRNGLQATLVLAGAGDEKLMAEIRNKASAGNMGDSVRLELRFLAVDELTAFFQVADIVVFPYSDITTSGALMTALHFRKAMIVSDLPLFRETFADGESAILTPYGDVDALASCLERLIRDPEQRRRLEEQVAGIAERQSSWTEIGRLTHACYRRLLGMPAAVETIACGGR